MTETLAPKTADAVLEAVRWALSGGTPLEVRGRGTKRGWGHPVEAGAVLDLSGLTGIIAYEPEELVLTVAAGTSMAEIEAAIAERGQMLAFEPPDLGPLWGGAPGDGTIGGVIGCNLSGPRRFKAGAARDHMLGVHAVSGRGEAFKAGGRVVKNVTGYDLPKLFCGAFGTLGVMTIVTVKVLPAPPAAVTLVLDGLDPAAATAAMSAAVNSPFEVSGAAHLPDGMAGGLGLEGPTARTLIRIEGFPVSVAERTRRVATLLEPWGPAAALEGEAAAAAWRRIRDVTDLADPAANGAPGPAAGAAPPAIWRLSVAPAAGHAVGAAIRAAGGRFYLDWGGGLVWAAMPARGDAGARHLRAAIAASGGGHATLLRGGEALRPSVPVFDPPPAPLAALERRVAAAFDPEGLLNRGRLGRPPG